LSFFSSFFFSHSTALHRRFGHTGGRRNITAGIFRAFSSTFSRILEFAEALPLGGIVLTTHRKIALWQGRVCAAPRKARTTMDMPVS
jgi:hypothetical protein